jgi:DNA (cytosine-5)-methyltransferase 1
MNIKELKKMGLNKIIQEIASEIGAEKWIIPDEIEELEAIVSHWLQSFSQPIPFLSNSILSVCENYIKTKTSRSKTLDIQNIVNETFAPYQTTMDFLFEFLPYPPPKTWHFTFIDLFAGIGGFRLAFQKAGGKCVFSSEWDKYAKKTYEANYGEIPFGDICKINKNEIPNHDVLCAGFPCQPFSLAGVSKKQSMGKKHGFEDETQGTLFFEIKEILRLKRPKAFMLENVKNLLSHNKGETFEVIRHALEDILGYVVNWKVVEGANWVPQHRERIFIVGYDPKQIQIEKKEIIIPDGPSEAYIYPELKTIIEKEVDGHTLGKGTWDTLERHKANHQEKGNGFGYSILNLPLKNGAVTRTISARYHKDGAEILIGQKNDRPRRLTVKEAMQLQGYDPKKFIFPVSNTQAYRQIGNSVVVPAIAACASEIGKVLQKHNNDNN